MTLPVSSRSTFREGEETPVDPEWVLDTEAAEPEPLADLLLERLRERGII